MQQYKRALLKLSGESLMGSQPFGIDQSATEAIATSLKDIKASGLELGVVLGGGNFFRGIKLRKGGLPATPADQMGMLATMINGIALKQALVAIGCPSRVLSALDCPKVVESYNWAKAQEYLAAGEILIFVGGTGNPYFTTDTAAALRASEIQADVLLKATKVDGVYNKDPKKFLDATRYDQITYSQFLAEKLEVMDATAIALCRNNHIPILVFNMSLLAEHKIKNLLSEKNLGTYILGE